MPAFCGPSVIEESCEGTMNRAYLEVISASTQDRRGIFLGAAEKLGTTAENVEKDFWVCWILDALFNQLPRERPRLLFKGGTSLAKGFGLIPRFSEDIDITVFRDDLGHAASVEELEVLSRKKRQQKLDAIKTSCRSYIGEQLQSGLSGVIERTFTAARTPIQANSLTSDDGDPDGQSLLFKYPTVFEEPEHYVQRVVRIESGAKSALEPHRDVEVTPYLATEVPKLDLSARGITAVIPERTFWDKIVILHGQRASFEARGVLRRGGERISRHYYDAYMVAKTGVGVAALQDRPLGIDCARHARMFFYRPDNDLGAAVEGRFSILPPAGMQRDLRRDYEGMAGMIFGEAPSFDDVLMGITALDGELRQ